MPRSTSGRPRVDPGWTPRSRLKDRPQKRPHDRPRIGDKGNPGTSTPQSDTTDRAHSRSFGWPWRRAPRTASSAPQGALRAEDAEEPGAGIIRITTPTPARKERIRTIEFSALGPAFGKWCRPTGGANWPDAAPCRRTSVRPGTSTHPSTPAAKKLPRQTPQGAPDSA